MGFFDDLFAPVKFFEIAAAMNNPKKFAETLDQVADTAEITANIISDQEMAEKLREGAGALKGVAGHIKTGVQIQKDWESVKGLYRAWIAIDPKRIGENPERAALAFGSLFAHAGALLEKLPPPLGAFGELLTSAGSFFNDVRKQLDLEDPDYAKSRKLRNVMERDGPRDDTGNW